MGSSQRVTLVRCCIVAGTVVAFVVIVWVIGSFRAEAWATTAESRAASSACPGNCDHLRRASPLTTQTQIQRDRTALLGCFPGPARYRHRGATTQQPTSGPVFDPARQQPLATTGHAQPTNPPAGCFPGPARYRHRGATTQQPTSGPVFDPARQQPLATTGHAQPTNPPAGCFPGPARYRHRGATTQQPTSGPVFDPARQQPLATTGHAQPTNPPAGCFPGPARYRHRGATTQQPTSGPVFDPARQQPLATTGHAQPTNPPAPPAPTPVDPAAPVHHSPGAWKPAGTKAPRPDRLRPSVERSGPTRADHARHGTADCTLRDTYSPCLSRSALGPLPTASKHRASQWTELRDRRCSQPTGVRLGSRTTTADTLGARGSFLAQARYQVASPRTHDHPQRPSSTPSRDGPAPLPPDSSGPSGPGAGPGGTRSTGNDGGGSSFHSIGLAVLVAAFFLRSPNEIRASFALAAFQHGSFLPSRLERPG